MLRILHSTKFLPVLLLISLCAPQALAEESKKDGSLDAMWKDKEISTTKEPKSIDTDTEFKIITPDTQGVSESDLTRDEKAEKKKNTTQSTAIYKPLCPYDQLKESPFIKKGTWPGVGPFENLNNMKSEFKDKFDNKLDLIFDGDNVAKAKLKLVNRSQKPSDILSLEMTADFLLEALGAKSVKIAKFNSAFEEQQSKLKEENKLTLNAGKLEVSIAREGENSSSSDISISVKHTEKVEEKKREPEKKSASNNKQSDKKKKVAVTDLKPVETIEKPKTNSTSLLDQPIVYKAPKPGPLLANNSQSLPTAQQNGSQDTHKAEFTKLLTDWQAIKKAVYKNRQNSSLLKLLGGAALTKQSKAIKWLLDNHRYYEVTPKGLSVESYNEITPKRKYEVVAKISERRQYVDANTMHILKDINSTYKASYTIEKIRGAWIIIDSKLVK